MRYARRMLPAALALLVLLLAGCSLMPSQTRTIRLVGNASKGFEWDYVTEGDPVLKELERKYVDGNIPGTSDAPGLFCFTFEGGEPGHAQLHFHYASEGGNGQEYLSSVVYDVTVDENGQITQLKPVGASILTEEEAERRAEADPDAF